MHYHLQGYLLNPKQTFDMIRLDVGPGQTGDHGLRRLPPLFGVRLVDARVLHELAGPVIRIHDFS